MSTRPNILFIMSDQHNAKFMGHLGHPDVKTPHLDRLASEGVRFDTCVTQNPICTPSRVSFISGQYPHNHGYYGLNGPHPGGLPTILGHYRNTGYTTGAIGKIHCPEYWVEQDCDVFKEACWLFSIGGCPEYDEYLRSKGVFFDRDDMYYQEQPQKRTQTWEGRVSRLKYEDSPEAWIARESIKFMEDAAAKDRPFVLHMSFPRPHEIYCPSEPFWSMYDESKISLPPNADYDMSLKAPHLRGMAEHCRKGEWTFFEPRTFEAGRLRKHRGYLGLVTQTDFAVGQALDWLREKGLEKDTIVIYTTDHGDYACEHGIMEKAPGICSDAITRIPFIWRWPGRFKTGHVANEIVETVDMVDTLCALTGLPRLETSDGKDLSPLLAGESRELHSIGVTEFAWSRSVRKGDWRYIYYPREMFAREYPEGFGELYNVKEDPWEMKNLYFDPAQAERIRRMREELMDWLVTTTRTRTQLPRVSKPSPQAAVRYKNATNADGKFDAGRLRELARRGGLHDRNYL